MFCILLLKFSKSSNGSSSISILFILLLLILFIFEALVVLGYSFFNVTAANASSSAANSASTLAIFSRSSSIEPIPV